MTEDDELGHHSDLTRNHHCAQQDDKQKPTAFGLDAGEAIRNDGSRQYRAHDGEYGNDD